MKSITLLLAIGFFSIVVLKAQSTSERQEYKKAFMLGYGWAYNQKQDLNYSPFIHTDGSPLNMLLDYKWERKNENHVSLTYGGFKANLNAEPYTYYSTFNKGEYTTDPHMFNHLDLNFTKLKEIKKKDKLQWQLGGKFRNRILACDYIYGSAGTFGYYASFGADLVGKANYQISDKHLFSTTLSLPVLSLICRSPYFAQDDEYFASNYAHNGVFSIINYIKRGSFNTWNKSQALDLELAYLYNVSTRMDLGVKYWLSYNQHSDPNPFTSITNTIYLTSNYKF